MLHSHSFEMCSDFAATQFELLDDVRYFLKAMTIAMERAGGMGYYEKCGTFKEDNLICATNVAKRIQLRL